MTSSRRNTKGPRKPSRLDTFLGRLPWRWICFFLGFLLYANTISHDYTQDDAIVIYDNMFTQEGIQGIPGLLTRDTFFGFFKTEGKSRLVAGGRYRPLTPVLFALEWELFGRAPWFGHLVNAILYGLTGVVVFLLLKALAPIQFSGSRILPFVLIGTMLYITHPVHTEAVANIKGRDEMMAFLLSMLAIWVVLRRKKPALKHFVLSAALLFLALMSKENAIAMVAMIPIALWMRGRPGSVLTKATTGSFLAAVLFLVIRGAVIGWEFGDQPDELMNNPFLKVEGNQFVPFSSGEKLATILFTLGKYLQLMIFPHPLTHDYYPRHIEIMQFGNLRVLASLAAYVLLVAMMVIAYLKKRKLIAFGILFYLGTLFLVSNIVFPIGTNMSERFLYMPSFGFLLAVSAGIVTIAPNRMREALIGAAVVALLFGARTITRNTVWKDNYTLFVSDIKTSRRSAKLLSATGGELQVQALRQENADKKNSMLNQSVTYLKEAVRIHPNYKLAYLLLGNGYYYLGNYEAAIPYFEQVTRIDPDYAEGIKNLAVAYRDAGKEYGEKKGNLQKAIAYLNKAYQLIPEDYETVHALGVAHGLQGNSAQAVRYFTQGIELAPENATAYFNLGLAYQNQGDIENATRFYNKAVELDPEIAKRRSDQ